MKYIFILSILSAILMAKIPDVVPVQWLKTHYKDSSLVIIDVRDTKEFQKGHLQNAVSVPVFEKLFYGSNLLLPPLSDLKKLFSQLGITHQSNILVYGGINPIWSARFYWISKVLGADNVGILKVSFQNWEKGTFPITTKIFKPKYQDFIPKINNSLLETKLDVLTSIGKAYIIDGRPSDFYIGKKSHAKRFGHIPKALNLPGRSLYNIDGTKSFIKDFDVSAKLYKNLDSKRPIILYCEDGADAAMHFLILKKLGFDVSIYEGSWLEWANDFHLPIETTVNR